MIDRVCLFLRRATSLAFLAVTLFWLTGCYTLNQAFTDGLADQPATETASVRAARAATDAEHRVTAPKQVRFRVYAKNGSVKHTPLYFQSPLEQPEEADTYFALSGADYSLWLLESGRYLLNIALFPVHVVMDPPWTLSTDHDQRSHGDEQSNARRPTDQNVRLASVEFSATTEPSTRVWKQTSPASP